MSHVKAAGILLLVGTLVVPPVARACGPFFYEAAPPLTKDEMSFSIKTLANLYDRATFKHWSAKEENELAEELTKAGIEALRLPAAEARPRLEALLARNREGAYRTATANFLYDLVDLSHSAGIPDNHREAYVQWRLSLAGTDNGILTKQANRGKPVEPPEWWDEAEKEQLRNKQKTREQWLRTQLATIEENLTACAPALQAHWLVQKGGLLFRASRFAEAMEVFDSVRLKFAEHPRGETADYMAVRCLIELARDATRKERPNIQECKEWTEAMEALDEFSGTHGEGRFRAELPGWSGALQLMGHNKADAFCNFIEQAEIEGHPEVARQALREAEQCLGLISEEEADHFSLSQAAEALAQHPKAAMRMVHFLIEPAATVDYERWPWDSEVHDEGDGPVKDRMARRWRLRAEGTRFLRELARCLVALPPPEANWDPFALAAAAWAATENGDHATALALCAKNSALLDSSDDLLTVRAIALQRAGQNEEAMGAWHRLVEKFPQSPLAAQAHQRLVALLHDAGRDAEALARAVAALPEEAIPKWQREENGPKADPDHPAFLSEDMRQWADTLALMAPLADIGQEWRKATHPKVRNRLGEVIVRRALAEGRIDLARPCFLEDTSTDKPPVEDNPGDSGKSPPLALPMTGVFARTRLDPLAARMGAASKATGEEAAKAWLQAGKDWSALYRAFSPPSPLAEYMNSDFRRLGFRLRQNAVTLGYPLPLVNKAVVRQDLLAPAMDCWERAAQADPRSPAAAEALFLHNEALRQRAESNPFLLELAEELDDTARSADLVRRLSDHPSNAPWLARTVAWDFRGVEWLPGNNPPNQVDIEVAEAMLGIKSNHPEEIEPKDFNSLPMLDTALNEGGLAVARERLAKFRAEAVAAQAPDGDPATINDIDDAAIVFEVPGITFDDARAYLGHLVVRKGEGVQPGGFPASVADLVDYLRTRESAESRNPDLWKQWAEAHPRSVRREAALFQYTRLSFRQYRGWTHFVNIPWPEGPLPHSRYPGITTVREKPADPAAMDALIAAFENEYPKSRYVGSLLLWKGETAIDRHDHAAAVEILSGLLEDPGHRDLQLDTALQLSDVFFRILVPEERPAVIAAIDKCPSARRMFLRLIDSQTVGGRLAVFRGCFPARP